MFAAFAIASATAYAQRELTDIPSPDPAIELESFEVDDAFEVNLFAADPAMRKPIQMSFDSAGRLWIVSSELYPHIEPGQETHDKVLILEDVDGDGRSDMTTVFADDLLMPTGIEPGDGGAYVANSTELLHLADTDGDGRADRRRVVLSGFGTEDTHHILHTLRWGPDGMLYFNQSIYIHSHIETPHGVRRLAGSGIWQFRPETLELNVLMRGLVNPWGHSIDRFGQSFATDGAGGEGINYVLPGASYTSAVGASRIMHGLNPGSPKHCGLEILSGRHIPDDWQGNMITNDFRAHRVCRFVVSEEGAGYVSQQRRELIRSTNVAFRPVDVKLGPDGAIYIADWYNPIIQHGEVDFRDPRRDHTHGRIWRVKAKGRPLVPRPALVGASTQELLAALCAPEDWTRQHAKLLLKARGRTVLPELATWVQNLNPTDPEVEHQRLEALWTYQALDVVEPTLLGLLLRARDHRVRAAATRVVQHWSDRLAVPLGLLAAQVVDEHPRVRLEAVRVLAHFPSPRAFDLAMYAYDQKPDRFLDYALWLTARELAPQWLPALEAGLVDFHGREAQLIFALAAVDSPAIVKPLVTLFESGQVPANREETVLTLMGRLGGPDELAMIFKLAVSEGDIADDRRLKLLDALTRATKERQVRPAGDLTPLGRLLGSQRPAVRAAAIRATGLWKVAGLGQQLFTFAADTAAPESVRGAAIDALLQLGGDESRRAIESLAAADQPAAIRRLATVALVSLDLDAAARSAVELLLSLPAGDESLDLLAVFLEREGGPEALAKALAGRDLPPDVAKLGIRAARSTGREQPALVAALQAAGKLSGTPAPPTAEELAALVAEVKGQGDPARGETVFRAKEQACLKCHAIAGAGGQVGPDLSSIGASAQIDYLIESILLPNKAVKENYHSVVVSTNDGRIKSGVVLRQNDRELVLRTAEDRELVIPVDTIDEQEPAGSIMPAGLADTLTHPELVDLVRFLSELGKVGPYAVGPERLARRWRVLDATPAAVDRLLHTSFQAASADDGAWTWSEAYSTVAGTLPLEAFPSLKIRDDAPGATFVRTQFEVTTAGPLKLAANNAEGLTLWLDGTPLEVAQETAIDATTGAHTLTLAIDRTKRAEPLRLELVDLPDSAAKAQWLGGK